jgi:Protein of unknown function (DUF3105)
MALVSALIVACGGDDGGSKGSSDGGELFPAGGSLPEQTTFDVEPAARAAGCELRSRKSRSEDDAAHTDSPDVRVDYPDNPPTFGEHWPPGYQAEDGLYEKAPADEALVHTMEHGRVIVWARPSLPADARKALRALFDEDSYQLVLTPRREMPYAVAATAWNGEPGPAGTGRTLGCPRWSEAVIDALRAFRDEHRSQGPEPVP